MNRDIPSIYTIIYRCCDTSGNCASVNRTVQYVSLTTPRIGLLGQYSVSVFIKSRVHKTVFLSLFARITFIELILCRQRSTLRQDSPSYNYCAMKSCAYMHVTPSFNTNSLYTCAPIDVRRSAHTLCRAGMGG